MNHFQLHSKFSSLKLLDIKDNLFCFNYENAQSLHKIFSSVIFAGFNYTGYVQNLYA